MQTQTLEAYRSKICHITEIGPLIESLQLRGERIVHCHGVFDLLHPGHLRHLQEARKQGDRLIVSITPDRFVNKGPGRPAFNESLRLEQLAALVFVDYVVLNDSPDAVSVIKKIRPNIYVKGCEYRDHESDITEKITEEANAVIHAGGEIYYTDDIVYSSSELINRFFDRDSVRLSPFIEKLKKVVTLDQLLSQIDSFKALKVLVIGDAIIDEYQYVEPLGQSGKGVHLTARLLEKETFLGGSLIIANHLASFVERVTLLTGVGQQCQHMPFIQNNLLKNVDAKFIPFDDYPTLTKQRFVLKDGLNITKLFETYSSNHPLLKSQNSRQVIDFLKEQASDFDLIVVTDFGNGFTNPAIIDALCQSKTFLAVNTQTNSGNRGYNVVTHYHRADFISLNEPEIRLAAHDRYSRLETVVEGISSNLKCPFISVTQGVNGVHIFSKERSFSIPALTTHAVDRVGAGDSYFALASLSATKGYNPMVSGFIGSAAAAMDIQFVGNKEAIEKIAFCKYITRLFK